MKKYILAITLSAFACFFCISSKAITPTKALSLSVDKNKLIKKPVSKKKAAKHKTKLTLRSSKFGCQSGWTSTTYEYIDEFSCLRIRHYNNGSTCSEVVSGGDCP